MRQRFATLYLYEGSSPESSERFEFMKVFALIAGAILLFGAPGVARAADPQAAPQNPPAAASTPDNAPIPQTTVPAGSPEGAGAAPLRVMVGKSLLIVRPRD